MENFAEQAIALGLSGQEAVEYVREQSALLRDQRAEERAAQREAEAAQREAEAAQRAHELELARLQVTNRSSSPRETTGKVP